MITFSKRKSNKSLKSIFVTPRTAISGDIRRDLESNKFWMLWLGKSIPYCLYARPKLILRSCRKRITRNGWKQNPTHVQWETYALWKAGQGRSCICSVKKKSWTLIAASCGRALFCRKRSSRNALKFLNGFVIQNFTDVAVKVTYNS